MSSDFSPEGSPFKPIEPNTWTLELLSALEQGNLSTQNEVIQPGQEEIWWSDAEWWSRYDDDVLRNRVTDELGGEEGLKEVEERLALSHDVSEQFGIVASLPNRLQQTGLFVLLGRTLDFGAEK
jgi:hypothetical protein